MNAAVEYAAWVAGIWLLIAAVAAWIHHRRSKRQPLPRRTPADVLADAAQHRAAEDLATCRAIWPDPPSWKTLAAQYRLDTAKQRKENEQP